MTLWPQATKLSPPLLAYKIRCYIQFVCPFCLSLSHEQNCYQLENKAERESWMHRHSKRCHIWNMSKNAMRRKAASLHCLYWFSAFFPQPPQFYVNFWSDDTFAFDCSCVFCGGIIVRLLVLFWYTGCLHFAAAAVAMSPVNAVWTAVAAPPSSFYWFILDYNLKGCTILPKSFRGCAFLYEFI